MFELSSPLGLTAALAASLMAARLRVTGSAFLIHHMGSHSRKSDTRSRHIAEWVGIATLSASAEAYEAAHIKPHHGQVFATLADPDAAFLHGHGFRPGTPYDKLWLLFWWTLVSPRFHTQLTLARLRSVFLEGPLWRQRAAPWFWGSVLALASCFGALPGFLLAFVTPLLLLGNIAAFLELASEHVWLTCLDLPPKQRHRQLSHGRHLGVMPPQQSQRYNPVAWAWWLARTALAAALRATVLGGDLSWHHRHHTGGAVDGWKDATQAYSAEFWNDKSEQQHAVASIGEAIARWFRSLSAQEQ